MSKRTCGKNWISFQEQLPELGVFVELKSDRLRENIDPIMKRYIAYPDKIETSIVSGDLIITQVNWQFVNKDENCWEYAGNLTYWRPLNEK